MVEIEEKLKRILVHDFGNAGKDFLRYKLKQKNIPSLDFLNENDQQRIIIEMIHNLYGDMVSHRRFREVLLDIFRKLYGFNEAEHIILWMDFFRGSPPIGFMENFFGKDIGGKLILIEEEKEEIEGIIHEEDAVQFSFIMGMIRRMFKEDKFLINDLSSIFMKYLIHGKENVKLTFRDFIKKYNGKSNKVLFYFRSYLLKNANEENITYVKELYNASEMFVTKTGKETKLKGIDDSEGSYLFRNIEKTIGYELDKYVDGLDSRKLIEEGKRISGIKMFFDASKEQKIKFMTYIINHSNIMSLSEQKERMVKLWLRRLLKV